MVRNPRMLMMCGLLAVATGAVLGSHVAPQAQGNDLSLLALMPGLVGVGMLESHAWNKPTTATPAPPVVSDVPLEGHRQPRGPRESRDMLDRDER